jgi:hypothetical protein
MAKVVIRIPSELAKKIRGNKEKFIVSAIKEKIKGLKKKR